MLAQELQLYVLTNFLSFYFFKTDSLEDEMQKDFIRKCLRKTPEERPTARELLFHPVLFEVHSLKLLAAHILVNTPSKYIQKDTLLFQLLFLRLRLFFTKIQCIANPFSRWVFLLPDCLLALF